MQNDSVRIVVLSISTLFACITGFIIYFVVLYRNKQVLNKQEQDKLQSDFKQELLKTQIEMQEQTLHYISQEIHDNITQVLSFVKLNLGLISGPDDASSQRIAENRELIAQTITDLRNLSKSLSFENIKQLGLVKTITKEVERVNGSGLLKINLSTEGEIYSLGEQHELVLFRIFQEALNNTLKHSGAKQLKISLQYNAELFNLTLEDDGKGFAAGELLNKGGSGLRNMENRAALLGAAATIKSLPGKGCCIAVNLNPLKLRQTIDGTHPNRFS